MKNISNTTQLIGHLGRDPELKTLESGKSVCNFSIATNLFYKDKDGNPVEKTTWHRIVAWDKQADNTSKLLKKGSFVALQGSLTYKQVEAVNSDSGNTFKVNEASITLEDFQILAFPKQASSEEDTSSKPSPKDK